MKEPKKTIKFRVGLNDENLSPAFYWNTKYIGTSTRKGYNSSPFKNGVLYINGFGNPPYTEVHTTFCWKVHAIAVALVCFLNSYYGDELPIIAKEDIEKTQVWKKFQKIVKDIMVKHKIGKGIKIGKYEESFTGDFDVYDWDPITKIGKMIDKGELLQAGFVEYDSGVLHNIVTIEKDRKAVLNEKWIAEILERPKYTIAFINE